MLPRNVILVFSLFILLVEGDLYSNDAGIQAMSTVSLSDKDSTSDESPTESMNAVSPDQLEEPQYYGGAPSDISSSSSDRADAPETAPELAAAAAKSVEEVGEEESSNSEEGGKKKLSSRSIKPQGPIQPEQFVPPVLQSPLLPPISPANVIQSPALPPQPIIPQPKSLTKSRTSKRRSRTNRRQI